MWRASRRHLSSAACSSSPASPWRWHRDAAPNDVSKCLSNAPSTHRSSATPEIYPAAARCCTDPRGGRRVTDELRNRMVEILPRLRRFAVALTGDLDQGDDLVQETCMRALSRVDQWQPGTRLDSWMYRIAQNLWLDRMRAKKVR